MQPDLSHLHDAATSPADGARPCPKSSVLPPKTPVGDYDIERPLGTGGCGVVYLARHRELDQSAAIKILHSSLAGKPKMIERFVREVEVVNLLDHPNIAAIYELGELADGRPYFVMEHLRGTCLDAVLRARGRLSPEEALDILEPVCEALSAAHEAGVIHRDVKPSNIIICDDGERRTTKLLDFGIAKLTDPDIGSGLTTAGHSLGTVASMAPEQINCTAVDARTDVYALGVLLYRLLTGRAPFTGTDVPEIALHHLETPAPRPGALVPVSPAIDAIVLRAMEKSRERRFDSASSFLSALREAVGKPALRAEELVDRDGKATAIYVELRFEVETDEIDDALAADIGRALDIVEVMLRDGGYGIVLATGCAVLAARPLSANAAEATAERLRSLEIAAALRGAIERRQGADRRVTSAVCAHVGGAVVRTSPRPEVIGGPVTRMTSWSLPEGARGLFATPEALGDIFDITPIEFTYNLTSIPVLAVSTAGAAP